MKAQPLRTCLGCHKRLPKSQLMRFVLDKGMVRHDSKSLGQGRGAYCCNDKNCLHAFCRQKKKVSRAFRIQESQIRFELKDWE